MYPAIVELSLRVLMTYRSGEWAPEDLTGTEEALCETAAATIKDYIQGIGRFSPQASQQPMPQLDAHQQYLASMMGMLRS